MASLKAKEILKMNQKDRDKKLEELKKELIKNQISSSKQGSSKAKEIRKIIARIKTIENSEKRREVNKK